MDTKSLYTMADYISPMAMTTIQISQDLQQELNKMKLFSRETYEEVIWNLIEDTKELSEETLADIKKSEADIHERFNNTVLEKFEVTPSNKI